MVIVCPRRKSFATNKWKCVSRLTAHSGSKIHKHSRVVVSGHLLIVTETDSFLLVTDLFRSFLDSPFLEERSEAACWLLGVAFDLIT